MNFLHVNICHYVTMLFQAHTLNVCVHELLLVTLIKEETIDQGVCKDGAQTEMSSFLTSHTNTSEPWGELGLFTT